MTLFANVDHDHPQLSCEEGLAMVREEEQGIKAGDGGVRQAGREKFRSGSDEDLMEAQA